MPYFNARRHTHPLSKVKQDSKSQNKLNYETTDTFDNGYKMYVDTLYIYH